MRDTHDNDGEAMAVALSPEESQVAHAFLCIRFHMDRLLDLLKFMKHELVLHIPVGMILCQHSVRIVYLTSSN